MNHICNMTEDEKKWRRRSDARTLAEAEEIKADKERLREAHQGAKEILDEEAGRLKGLAKIVSNPTVSKAVRVANQQKQEDTTSFIRSNRFSNPATIGKLF